MKNRNGFTLLELLAVIVILSIIALIASPVIINLIEDSGTTAAEDSAQLILRQAQFAYEEAYMLCEGQRPSLAFVMSKMDMKSIDSANIDEEKFTITDGYGTTCTLKDGEYATCKNTNYPKSNIGTYKTKSIFISGDCDKR